MLYRGRKGLAAATAVALALTALGPASALGGRYARGIDVSRFQAEINWKQVGGTKVRFAFVQASRGSGDDCAVVPEECGADRFYRRNYRGARGQGIRVGPYHRAFAEGGDRSEAKLDARAEADVFVEEVGELRRRDLLPALDVEQPFAELNAERLRLWVRTWLKRVERKLGDKPIIYTNSSSWAATGDTTEFALAGHHLWVANWGVPEPSVPADDWGGNGWSVWQFTSSGRVRGIDGNVDKDRMRVGFHQISAQKD
jgi:lysozyme